LECLLLEAVDQCCWWQAQNTPTYPNNTPPVSEINPRDRGKMVGLVRP
jgi:hypothetical protein